MTTQSSSTPLVLSRDPALVDDVLRLSAAAGVTPEVLGDAPAVRRHWSSAPVVLVGVDLAEELAEVAPARRPAVHIVARGDVPDGVFRTALALGAEHVAALPRSDDWLVELLTDLGEGRASPGRVIGVIGGSGGAGATTFVAALASVAARSGPTLAIDLDPLGPGLDRVLGMEGLAGIRWDALQQSTGRLSARSLREAVPRRGGVGVLTCPPGVGTELAPFAVREVISAARRGHHTVVVDLPRALGAVVADAATRCDHLVVLTVGSLTGLTSAGRVCAGLDLPGVVHVVRGATDHAAVTRVTGRPVLVGMRDQRGLSEAVDLGAGPVRGGRGTLARAARTVLEKLAGTQP